MFRYAAVCVVVLSLLFSGGLTNGQMIDRVVPTPHYFEISMAEFNRGEFVKALAEFNYDLKNMVKVHDVNGVLLPWLDALCYMIMAGECHYQLGRYDDAMKLFDNAVQIYLNNSHWLANVSCSAVPVPVQRPALPWGATTRKGELGNFRNCRFQILQQHMNLMNLGNQGQGLMQQQQMTTIHAHEIINKLSLLIRRRGEILGPLAKYDKLTKDITQILGGRPCPPNHFSGVWVDVLYGLALSAMGDDEQAVVQLEKGLLMLNRIDHQLTAQALNELGLIALRAGKNPEALVYFFEASLAARYFDDWALLGETFVNAANAQRLIDKTKPLPALQNALTYFQNLRFASPLTILPICNELAEAAILAGDLRAAQNYCNQASNIMAKRAIGETVHAARSMYLRAMLTYITAYSEAKAGREINLNPGDEQLATALNFMRRGSLWLHQLACLESLFQQGAITAAGPITTKAADELYEYLLREPTASDWATRPIECLAHMIFTPPEAYQRWFYVALQRGEREKAFDISEKARTAKFFSWFKLGPRMLSLRILFEGENVNQQLLLQRQSLSLDFQRFSELSKQVDAVKKKLAPLPLMPKNDAETRQQKEALSQLAALSQEQEAMLRPIALTRNKAPIIFPPVLTLEQIRKRLPEGTAMLVYFEALGRCYGFLVDKSSLNMWELIQESREPSLQKLISDFLDGLGNKGANQALTVKELTKEGQKWEETGALLQKRLLGNEQRQANFTELVIVPTGPIWYAPFEAMCVKTEGKFRPFISAGTSLSIRYAPTASLGVPDITGNVKDNRSSEAAETLVICGRFHNKSGTSLAYDAVDRYTKGGIANLVPMAVFPIDENYRDFPGNTTAFASQLKRLVVLDDIVAPKGDPLKWTPFNADKNKIHHPVSSWLSLPWGGPQLVVLPGFHTAAENALKTERMQGAITNGDDLFLSAMVLQACGAKTILLSRWRVGGRSTFDLTGHFLKNIQTMGAAEAWRQSILDVGVEPLVLAEEPRLRPGAGEVDVPSANHPFFWSSFILLDRGERPLKEDDGKDTKTKLD